MELQIHNDMAFHYKSTSGFHLFPYFLLINQVAYLISKNFLSDLTYSNFFNSKENYSGHL